ncbi:uncharacterized protein PV07_11799 [Cladophialophora immunda]|uniref:Autophagy-related protein n=1 Tax=Cladophialophora immunda TaxID=569365 RepID=A0A0D2AFG4_9EURO|nr:uncharacterized protein PV07_11799 [Cladophialophora immunda]KIW23612.1 hypothetical protein PV07_11799 [Cladophialophora immunda]
MGVKGYLRWHGPFMQNALAALCLGLTAGIYVALSGLGAGGGQATSQHMIDIAQASCDAASLVAGLFCGVMLNKFGPAICASVGAVGYAVYVGGFWYFGEHGTLAFPVTGATILGITAVLIESTVSYIAIAYSEEREKGLYVTMMQVIKYGCSLVAATIPLAIDASNPKATSVPTAVYITFIILMSSAVVLGLFILPAEKIRRDDGTGIAVLPKLTFKDAMLGGFHTLADKRLLLLCPALICTAIHLVYCGIANAYHNNSRVRALNTFCALAVAIPSNLVLSWLLDNRRWSRKTRALAGTTYVGVFLIGAFIAEVVRTWHWSRVVPHTKMDWTSPDFAGQFILFIVGWNAAGMILNLATWYLGTLSNDPLICSHYAGLSRALLAVGQGFVFGIDAAGIPYRNEAGALLGMFSISMLGMYIFAFTCVQETRYFKEEHVIVPRYAQEQLGHIQGQEAREGAKPGADGSDEVHTEVIVSTTGEKNTA